MGKKLAKVSKSETIENYKKMTGTEYRGAAELGVAQTMQTIQQLNINGDEVDCSEVAQQMLWSLKPQDAMEGMLASQMIALHNLAMDCSSKAMASGQTFEVRDMNLKHAVKLMNAFSNAVSTLDKHRGKGQQKITVEHQHVQVEAGGQAIIGDVHHKGGADEKDE